MLHHRIMTLGWRFLGSKPVLFVCGGSASAPIKRPDTFAGASVAKGELSWFFLSFDNPSRRYCSPGDAASAILCANRQFNSQRSARKALPLLSRRWRSQNEKARVPNSSTSLLPYIPSASSFISFALYPLPPPSSPTHLLFPIFLFRLLLFISVSFSYLFERPPADFSRQRFSLHVVDDTLD